MHAPMLQSKHPDDIIVNDHDPSIFMIWNYFKVKVVFTIECSIVSLVYRSLQLNKVLFLSQNYSIKKMP